MLCGYAKSRRPQLEKLGSCFGHGDWIGYVVRNPQKLSASGRWARLPGVSSSLLNPIVPGQNGYIEVAPHPVTAESSDSCGQKESSRYRPPGLSDGLNRMPPTMQPEQVSLGSSRSKGAKAMVKWQSKGPNAKEAAGSYEPDCWDLRSPSMWFSCRSAKLG